MNGYNDILAQKRANAMRGWVLGIGAFVYVGALLYATIHNISLITKGFEADYKVFGIGAVMLLTLTAIGLPLALHYWCKEPTHRIIAFIFYGYDFLALVGNCVADFNLNAGTKNMPNWISVYLTWFVPATPLIAAFFWSMLFLFDPRQRSQHDLDLMQETARQDLTREVMREAGSQYNKELIQETAKQVARTLVQEITRLPTSEKPSLQHTTPALPPAAALTVPTLPEYATLTENWHVPAQSAKPRIITLQQEEKESEVAEPKPAPFHAKQAQANGNQQGNLLQESRLQNMKLAVSKKRPTPKAGKK